MQLLITYTVNAHDGVFLRARICALSKGFLSFFGIRNSAWRPDEKGVTHTIFSVWGARSFALFTHARGTILPNAVCGETGQIVYRGRELDSRARPRGFHTVTVMLSLCCGRALSSSLETLFISLRDRHCVGGQCTNANLMAERFL